MEPHVGSALGTWTFLGLRSSRPHGDGPDVHRRVVLSARRLRLAQNGLVRLLPPPKSDENDGSNASCCSDKGAVCACRPQTHAARPRIIEARAAMSMELPQSHVLKAGATSGRTGISIREMPSPAPKRREDLIFMDHFTKETPNSMGPKLRKRLAPGAWRPMGGNTPPPALACGPAVFGNAAGVSQYPSAGMYWKRGRGDGGGGVGWTPPPPMVPPTWMVPQKILTLAVSRRIPISALSGPCWFTRNFQFILLV